MKKFVVMLLVALFTLGGGEKIFGETNHANARIVYSGAEMKDVHFNLLKGYLYEAVIKGEFDDEMKAKTAEMLVWATKLLVHKEVFDLTDGKDNVIGVLVEACSTTTILVILLEEGKPDDK